LGWLGCKTANKTVMIPFPKELFTLQDQRKLLESLALKASIVAAKAAPAL